jgi:protein-disulfide isomerase
VAAVFLISASGATSLTAIPARLGEDFSGLTRSQTATTLAVAWLAASVALLVLFPREQVVTAAEAVAQEAPEPVIETLSPEQIAEWDKYLDSQMPVADLLPADSVKVRVVKFNDYQCPSCRQTWALYRGLLAKYEKQYPGVFVFQTIDFPLETECGVGGNHNLSCEAAAAVRMARERNKDREVEAWLFNNQSFEMTRDELKKGLADVAQINDFDTQYPKYIDAVRADSQLGQKLGVNSTPTFYINGIKLFSLRPAYFDAAIQHALKRAGVTS